MVSGGLVGIPWGCRRDEDGNGNDMDASGAEPLDSGGNGELPRSTDGGPYPDGYLDGRQGIDLPDDLSTLPEATPEEVEDFLRRADEGTRAYDAAGGDLDGSGRPKIPPGQQVVDTMWQMGSDNPDPRTRSEWKFHVKGEVDKELLLTWDEFAALPHVDLTCNVHCVTGWTFLNAKWQGVRLSTLFEQAGLKDSAKFVIFDCEQGYTTNIPLDYALKPDVLVATGLFGPFLSPLHGGPARGLVPDKYFYKSGKWVTGLRILDHDEPGYWETKGYSNTADPWTQDRYS